MSEYLVYPSYMQKNKTAGDMTFGFKDSTGIHIDKVTCLDPKGKYIPKSLVLDFQRGGTCFVIKSFDKPIKIQGRYITGILITASHCVSDTSTFKPDSDMLECIIDDKRHHAFFLKSFMEDYRNPMISSTSGNYFVYSGDIALLLLVSNKKVKFHCLPFGSFHDIRITEEVKVIGYPSRPSNMLNCCPALCDASEDELEKEMNKVFHNFNSIVYSVGSIIDSSDSLLDINCASVNGMSGGPVITSNKIIGVYVGGPPLYGQYQLYLINQIVLSKDFASAFYGLLELRESLISYSIYDDISFIDKLEGILFECVFLDIVISNSAVKYLNSRIWDNIKNNFVHSIKDLWKQFFLKSALKKYRVLMDKHKTIFHFTGRNLFSRQNNFIEAYHHIERFNQIQQYPRLVLTEVKSLIILLIIVEIKYIEEGEISRDILLDPSYEAQNVLLEGLSLEFFNKQLQKKIKDFNGEFVDATYAMIVSYNWPQQLKHNVAISVIHPIFERIQSFLDRSDSLLEEKYRSINQLVSDMRLLLNK